jgi:dihydroorotate dehydrogenase (fumarate)
MVDLSTKYLGFRLRNPIIVGSSSLTNNIDGIRRCVDAGAGAIVLKSLFEEQIDYESKDIVSQHSWLQGHLEAFNYVKEMRMGLGSNEYLALVREAKKATSIPIIASLNCISPLWWTSYAKQIEISGADALELNISIMSGSLARSGEEIEHLYFKILDEVRSRIKIPVAVKIGPYFTSLPQLALGLSKRGANALVLFNRFYQLDIDIEKFNLIPGHKFSVPEETALPLRWVALLSGRVNCDLVASTGIHTGADVIKHLLVGATAVQVCSTLFLNGVEYIGEMLNQVEGWMKRHKVKYIDQIRDKLQQKKASSHEELYERLQYIKALTGIE